MSEKIYYGKRLEGSPIRLDYGKKENYYWLILTLGTHPTAYVGVLENHPFFNLDCNDFYEKGINIDVHCGFTYSNNKIAKNPFPNKNIWWFGWDYGHYGDFVDYSALGIDFGFLNEKKWTLDEIKKEVFGVIRLFEKMVI